MFTLKEAMSINNKTSCLPSITPTAHRAVHLPTPHNVTVPTVPAMDKIAQIHSIVQLERMPPITTDRHSRISSPTDKRVRRVLAQPSSAVQRADMRRIKWVEESLLLPEVQFLVQLV
ncbi:uncharacterized protein LDX57_001142 [Aspergillus melleus]|uniref:uncharacterized protein n=1 Tax=Aspergillus melleus TaxID=138277 RepID=UPI001E8CF406|nr:uncharacterized protein LDX57_001142 [Aspergillus melleus]KAH8423384.1 hypothetical protein LDX57_001142 [Aspergillus melleus]